jgi:V-type H+-transporting ATPase subunit C
MKELILNSLDSLLRTNDDLQRVDLEFESYLKTLEKRILDLQPKTELKVALNQNPVKVDEAIAAFQWEDSKYPKSQKTIEQVMEKFSEKLTTTKVTIKKISDNLNTKLDLYKNLVKSDK